MLRIIAFILLLACFTTSCVTQKACDRKFPPQESVVVKDSIVYKEKIVVRDTTIFLPGERVTIVDTAYCDSLGRAQLPKKQVKTKHLTATVEIKNGKVTVDCKEDSLIKVNAQLHDKIINLESYNKKETVVIKEVYKTYWFDKWCRIIVILLIVYVGYKIYKTIKTI